jgi:predicted GTPase
MHKVHQRCTELIERTDKELSGAVTLMLLAAQENLPPVPDNVKFRVLIIGRANSGKTSVLQRVFDTTESPEVYKVGPTSEVRGSFLSMMVDRDDPASAAPRA